MLFKVIQDGLILDAWDSPVFVKYSARHGAFVTCNSKEEADGVVLPSETDIWLLEESSVRIEGKEVAQLVEITQEEFDALVEQLEETGGGIKEQEPEEPEPPEDEPGPDVPEEPERPQEEITMTRAEMTKAIKTLQEQNAELHSTNEMLLECLMEMSEFVYA